MKRPHAWFAWCLIPLLMTTLAVFTPAASAQDADGPGVASLGDAPVADAADPTFLERLWNSVGTFHPAIVHFPIALITFAAICIVIRIAYRKLPIDVPYYCLCFGALTAPVAALMGWAFAPFAGHGGWDVAMDGNENIFWHRWAGVVVAVAALIVLAAAVRARLSDHPGHHRVWQIGVLLLAPLVGLVGHQGGGLVYGDNLYASPWVDKKIEIAVEDVPTADGKVDFVAHIKPIFEAACVKCHGAERDKGDLRMHTKAALLAGGSMQEEGLHALVPGDPVASYLLELMTSTDEDEMMPPKKEGGPLKPAQIDLVRQWIEQGADWPEGLTLQEAK